MATANSAKFAPFAFASTTAINPPPYYNKAAGDKDGMHYIRFGTTGAVVSRICLGLMSYAHVNEGEPLPRGWTIPQHDAEQYVQQALEAGITFYDTVSSPLVLPLPLSLSPLCPLLLTPPVGVSCCFV
jgi:hypothetical protein